MKRRLSVPIFIKASARKAGKAAHGKYTVKETIMRNGRLPDVTQIAVSTLRRGLTEPKPHRHPTMWEIYFILKGRAIYYVGTKQYRVSPGDFLAVPPGVFHNQKVTLAPHVIFYWGIATGAKLKAYGKK